MRGGCRGQGPGSRTRSGTRARERSGHWTRNRTRGGTGLRPCCRLRAGHGSGTGRSGRRPPGHRRGPRTGQRTRGRSGTWARCRTGTGKRSLPPRSGRTNDGRGLPERLIARHETGIAPGHELLEVTRRDGDETELKAACQLLGQLQTCSIVHPDHGDGEPGLIAMERHHAHRADEALGQLSQHHRVDGRVGQRSRRDLGGLLEGLEGGRGDESRSDQGIGEGHRGR